MMLNTKKLFAIGTILVIANAGRRRKEEKELDFQHDGQVTHCINGLKRLDGCESCYNERIATSKKFQYNQINEKYLQNIEAPQQIHDTQIQEELTKLCVLPSPDRKYGDHIPEFETQEKIDAWIAHFENTSVYSDYRCSRLSRAIHKWMNHLPLDILALITKHELCFREAKKKRKIEELKNFRGSGFTDKEFSRIRVSSAKETIETWNRRIAYLRLKMNDITKQIHQQTRTDKSKLSKDWGLAGRIADGGIKNTKSLFQKAWNWLMQ